MDGGNEYVVIYKNDSTKVQRDRVQDFIDWMNLLGEVDASWAVDSDDLGSFNNLRVRLSDSILSGTIQRISLVVRSLAAVEHFVEVPGYVQESQPEIEKLNKLKAKYYERGFYYGQREMLEHWKTSLDNAKGHLEHHLEKANERWSELEDGDRRED